MNSVLLVATPDSKGLIAKITAVIFSFNVNIDKNDEFVVLEEDMFFMRSALSGHCDLDALKVEIQNILPKEAKVSISRVHKKNIVLFCTKESHCLGDLLIRYDSGELNANILAVISNYEFLRPLCEKFCLPFIHIPAENKTREEHEREILKELGNYPQIDCIVLAKYMRILSQSFVEHYSGKILNIHHSFLPAFVGANPYKQAYKRGVKIIGATAHFVNENLDDGPIICQDIIKIDHSFMWQDMQRAGMDVEKIVLARALKLFLEDRIFVFSNKTIIF